MIYRSLLSLVALVMLAAAPAAQAEDGDYIVIVNAANPLAKISRADLENMYLRRKTSWANGNKVIVVDLPEGHPARAKFAETVLKKSADDLKRYWQQQIFAGREQPPHQAASVAEVMRTVDGNQDAVGYVPATTKVQYFKGIKTLPVE